MKTVGVIIFIALCVALVWWAIGQGKRNEAYYTANCPHGHMMVHGFGYCLDEGGNPYMLE